MNGGYQNYLVFIRRTVRGKNGLVFVAYQSASSFPFLIVSDACHNASLACLRASDIHASGQDLLSKIHDLIGRADIVIADLTKPNPNVYYELGYAAAQGKRFLLTLDTSDTLAAVPSDLRGLEYIPYSHGDALAWIIHVFARLAAKLVCLSRNWDGRLRISSRVV